MPDLAILGNGDGTKGAVGPGILQTLGMVALAIPMLPLVTGVLGGCMETLGIDLPPVRLVGNVCFQQCCRTQTVFRTCP